MPEMIEAGLDALQAHEPDAFRGLPEHRLVCEIYRAMEDAKPPGYTARMVAAITAKCDAEWAVEEEIRRLGSLGMSAGDVAKCFK